MELQKKSLKHVSGLLGKFDTYPIYKAVKEALDEAGVAETNKSKILSTLQGETYEMKQIVTEAKDWVDTIITTLE